MPPRRPERLCARRRTSWPRSRLCCSSRCIERTGLGRSTRTFWVSTACAEWYRSRPVHMVGCGHSGHQSTPAATGGTAAAAASSARSAGFRLAARCAASTFACCVSPPATPHCADSALCSCPAFDSLLISAARWAGAISAIVAEVAGGASAPWARFSKFFCLPRILGLLLVAARGGLEQRGSGKRGCGGAAARRLPSGGLGRSPALFPLVLASLCSSSFACLWRGARLVLLQKSVGHFLLPSRASALCGL